MRRGDARPLPSRHVTPQHFGRPVVKPSEQRSPSQSPPMTPTSTSPRSPLVATTMQQLTRQDAIGRPTRQSYAQTLREAAETGAIAVMRDVLASLDEIDGTDASGATALYLSCAHGHAECTQLLVQQGANLDHATRFGTTPLGIACYEGHSGCVAALLEATRSADIDKVRLQSAVLQKHCT